MAQLFCSLRVRIVEDMRVNGTVKRVGPLRCGGPARVQRAESCGIEKAVQHGKGVPRRWGAGTAQRAIPTK